jgi:hypothetical protein
LVTLWNGLAFSLPFSATVDNLGGPDFLKVSPADGELVARSGTSLGLLADSEGLSPGTYSADVIIGSPNPLILDLIVNVSLDIGPRR